MALLEFPPRRLSLSPFWAATEARAYGYATKESTGGEEDAALFFFYAQGWSAARFAGTIRAGPHEPRHDRRGWMVLTDGAALPGTERSSEPARSRGWYAGPTRQRVGRRASARKDKRIGPRAGKT